MATAKAAKQKQSSSVRKNRAFEQLAAPYRREIKLHCYRMLGSLHEAEDLVQETYLRAWRSFDRLDSSGSFRPWIYKIATNACLNALASRKRMRRWLPDERVPATTEMPDGKPAADVAWLEPYPDAELIAVADDASNPEARYAADESVQLAFVAAIQYLPPRQRAVLLLCDVLGWAATEAASLLGGSVASINSALQRARETLSNRYSERLASVHPQPDTAQQNLLGRYLKAWESLDVSTFVSLLKEDATFTMPPLDQWYAGREAIRSFFQWAFRLYADFRLVPIRANRQPAFAAYSRARAGGQWTAHSIQVLTLQGGSISRLTLFAKPDSPGLFEAFRLPLTLEDGNEYRRESTPES
jgi:RNA polymerase sigma-70 factor (ECF subfamily)